MKTLLYYGFSLYTFVLFSSLFIGCAKEEITTLKKLPNVSSQKTNSQSATHQVKTRSYFWTEDGKLDCSQDGSGCEVGSKYISVEGEIDLALLQLLKLIQIGTVNLNQYFTNNNLSYEFPVLYTAEFQSRIYSGDVSLQFEYPYFMVLNGKGETVKVYNYSMLGTDQVVLAALQGAGEYSRKVQLNTDPDKPVVWKCTAPGDNCKVSRVRYNAAWLASNPQFLFIPSKESIKSTEIDYDTQGGETRVVVSTVNENVFGVQF